MGGQCPGAPELEGLPGERQKNKQKIKKKKNEEEENEELKRKKKEEKKRENETFQIPGLGPPPDISP